MNGNKREKNTQRKQYVLVRSLTIFSRPFNFLSLFVGALFIKSNEWILVSIFLPYFSISRTIIYIYIYRRIHSHKPSFHLATTLTFFFFCLFFLSQSVPDNLYTEPNPFSSSFSILFIYFSFIFFLFSIEFTRELFKRKEGRIHTHIYSSAVLCIVYSPEGWLPASYIPCSLLL